MKLTPRQEVFVREYLIDLNATQAAIRAGYAPNAAKVQASRLLTKANITDAIAKAQSERADRLEITADRVTQEMARLAFFDSKYVYDQIEGGEFRLKTFEQMGEWTRCISEIREDRIIKESADGSESIILQDKRTVKFHDKTSNLKTLAEYLGILKNQQPVFPENVTFRFVYAAPQTTPKGNGKGKG
jgi:phage terminase small subunit